MKPISEELKTAILDYAASKKGHIYAPVLHPEFAHLRSGHNSERFDAIIPHLEYPGGTVLDVGAHWGYVSQRLEDLGYKVTAVENSAVHFPILKGLRDACEKKFEVLDQSIFDMRDCKYDIVFALNIFHHFLKKKPKFEGMNAFLSGLDCKMMIYEGHSPDEGPMVDAYRPFGPFEMAHYVGSVARLPKVEVIGKYRKRTLFKLTR